jgi:hypothetical protein
MWNLEFASRRLESRQPASVCQGRVIHLPWSDKGFKGILIRRRGAGFGFPHRVVWRPVTSLVLFRVQSRRRDYVHRDARRRFVSVVSFVFPGILCSRRDTRCRFASVVSFVFPGLIWARYGILSWVATLFVATPFVGLPVSCLMASLCSPLRDKQLCSWRRSSIVLSFRATGNALTENRIQGRFPEYWPCHVRGLK